MPSWDSWATTYPKDGRAISRQAYRRKPEVHPKTDQFIRVDKGKGKAVFNGKEKAIADGSAFIIPQGTTHNIINTGNVDLKIYTLYSPPHHQKDTIRNTKEEAEKKKERFDGKTDV